MDIYHNINILLQIVFVYVELIGDDLVMIYLLAMMMMMVNEINLSENVNDVLLDLYSFLNHLLMLMMMKRQMMEEQMQTLMILMVFYYYYYYYYNYYYYFDHVDDVLIDNIWHYPQLILQVMSMNDVIEHQFLLIVVLLMVYNHHLDHYYCCCYYYYYYYYG